MKRYAFRLRMISLWMTALLLLTGFCACSNSSPLPVTASQASYAIDRSDKAAVVGHATYVFVGRVSRFLGTEYPELSTPYTSYAIEVLENLKGELSLGEICALKFGGVVQTQSQVIVDGEDDFFPMPGDCCIFSAYGQKDGTLHFSGACANVRIVQTDADKTLTLEELQKTEVYLDYLNACAHPVESASQERSLCVFDANYTGSAERKVPDAAAGADKLASLLPATAEETLAAIPKSAEASQTAQIDPTITTGETHKPD